MTIVAEIISAAKTKNKKTKNILKKNKKNPKKHRSKSQKDRQYNGQTKTVQKDKKWSTIRCTVPPFLPKYSSPSILRYIFHIKPHFSKTLL